MAKGLDMGTPALALLATLAVAGFTHREELGRMLGQVMGKDSTATGDGGLTGNSHGAADGARGSMGDLLGGLGEMLRGGSAGGILSEGLGGLLERFRSTGHADDAESWVKDGPNRSIDPSGIEQALGPDVIDELRARTGLSREQLLERLSTNLPRAVDSLTPQGRIPTPSEASNFALGLG